MHTDSRIVFVAALVALATPPVAGQDTRSQSFPGLDKAGPPVQATTRQAKTNGERTMLARVVKPSVLRELRSAKSQAVSEQLAKGTFVLIHGKPSYDFVRVSVPGGFKGWVHRGFVRVGDDGWAETTGTRVSFRYRPKSGEPPLASIAEAGARLPALERKGDWWQVLSNPSITAWLPVAAVDSVDIKIDPKADLLAQITDAALEKELAAQLSARRAPWTTKRAEFAKAAKRNVTLRNLAATLADVREAYRAAIARTDVSKKELKPLLDTVEKVRGRIVSLAATDAPVGVEADNLRTELKRRIVLTEIKAVVSSEPKVKKREPVEAAVPAVPARRRFKSVGWLEFRPGSDDFSPYRISKGGRLICYVTCRSGRYDLADFVGREIGVRGTKQRPASAAVSVIDVDRLVILSGRR